MQYTCVCARVHVLKMHVQVCVNHCNIVQYVIEMQVCAAMYMQWCVM